MPELQVQNFLQPQHRSLQLLLLVWLQLVQLPFSSAWLGGVWLSLRRLLVLGVFLLPVGLLVLVVCSLPLGDASLRLLLVICVSFRLHLVGLVVLVAQLPTLEYQYQDRVSIT